MIRLIALLLLALLAACAPAPTPSQPQPAPAGPRSFPVSVDSVQIEVAESLPVQVFARVQGMLGDGCTSLGAISQRRDGNTIEVTVLANHSGAEACTMIAQMLDERVQLEGAFPAGDYTVIVNGVTTSFTI